MERETQRRRLRGGLATQLVIVCIAVTGGARVGIGHSHAAEVYKCDGPQGRVIYQDEPLGRAMIEHALLKPALSWRGIAQLPARDTQLWCRDIQVDTCYRLLHALCGLNGRYFTRFQVKRVGRLAARPAIAPPALAERIDALLSAPPAAAFDALHALEGEVLDLVAAARPEIDLAPAHRR
jgi:hypothetical protein